MNRKELTLTPREQDILEILKEPLIENLEAVGKRLNISPSTVSQHLYRIKEKYKKARRFVNQIDALRGNNQNIAYYLRTKARV